MIASTADGCNHKHNPLTSAASEASLTVAGYGRSSHCTCASQPCAAAVAPTTCAATERDLSQ